MASAKDLKKRITTVKNTQQITKAMKMVSAAKLRRAQEAVVALRPFAIEISKIINTITKTNDIKVSSQLLEPKKNPKSLLLITVTSDRGLCGAFNANIVKTAQKFMKEEGPKYESVDLAFIGKKGYEFFKERKPGKYYTGLLVKMNYLKAKELSQELIGLYTSGKYDEVKFIYNEFKSALSQKINVEQLLPVGAMSDSEAVEGNKNVQIVFEPNPKEILDRILPRHFSTQVLRICFESLASEHAARMTAMDNASGNASDMLKALSLEYNKTRQGAITKELLEIISGSEAQKA